MEEIKKVAQHLVNTNYDIDYEMLLAEIGETFDSQTTHIQKVACAVAMLEELKS